MSDVNRDVRSVGCEKLNEDENVVDSEGKHTLFSVQAKKTTEE